MVVNALCCRQEATVRAAMLELFNGRVTLCLISSIRLINGVSIAVNKFIELGQWWGNRR